MNNEQKSGIEKAYERQTHRLEFQKRHHTWILGGKESVTKWSHDQGSIQLQKDLLTYLLTICTIHTKSNKNSNFPGDLVAAKIACNSPYFLIFQFWYFDRDIWYFLTIFWFLISSQLTSPSKQHHHLSHIFIDFIHSNYQHSTELEFLGTKTPSNMQCYC